MMLIQPASDGYPYLTRPMYGLSEDSGILVSFARASLLTTFIVTLIIPFRRNPALFLEINYPGEFNNQGIL